MYKRIVIVFIVFAVLLAVVSPSFAQDSAPALPPVPNIEEAGELLLKTLTALLIGVAGSPFVRLLVSILQRIPGLDKVSDQTLALFLSGLVVVGVWLSRYFGVEVQFRSVIDFLMIAFPAVTTLLAAMFGDRFVLRISRAYNVPVFRYQASDENAQPLTAEAFDEIRFKAMLIKVVNGD